LGDWICEMERGRPLGMSRLRAVESRRDSRREEDEWDDRELDECFDDEDELDFEEPEELDLCDRLLDFSGGTSRMFKTRPVVGSVVDAVAGS